MTVYTAIFSNYERLKEPAVVTPGWKYICYTDQPFKSNVWHIKQVPSPSDPRREARKYKALFHLYTKNKYSLWLDGSFRISTDLNIFWEKYFTSPFSCPSHPLRKCVYEEIRSVINSQRGGYESIGEQERHYRQIGVPKNTGIITSGILLRERTNECIDLCEDWWNETNKWSLRDQVSFAKVSIGRNFHTFQMNYTLSRELIYIKHKDKFNTFAV